MMTLRPAVWTLAMASALAITVTPNLAVAFQSTQGMEYGRGPDQGGNREWGNGYSNNPHYQQGIKQGQADAAKNRERRYRFQSKNDADRRAYEAGYDQGYRDYNRNADNNARYGQNGQNGRSSSLAAQAGSQDGWNDGHKDRQTGHSNRPTKGDNYKNATRGFTGGAGQTAYKADYRQAYVPAYQQGYASPTDGRR